MNLDKLIESLTELRARVAVLGDLDDRASKARVTVDALNAQVDDLLKQTQAQKSVLAANAQKAQQDLMNQLAARQQHLNETSKRLEIAKAELDAV